MHNSMKQILSYGGGVQSVATCVLIQQGKLPKPDLIIMSDTGREKHTTFDYLHAVIQPLLQPLGLNVTIIKAKDWLTAHDYNILTHRQNGKIDIKLPARHQGGLFRNFCSDKWKRRVIRRYLRSLKIQRAQLWLGFTLDEKRRAKASDVKWLANCFPLINALYPQHQDLGRLALSRSDCQTLIQQAGLPLPNKSSCYMCPHMTDTEWMQLSAKELD